MKKIRQIFLLMMLITGCAAAVFPQEDKQVGEIRTIARETEQKIAECEANGDVSRTFLTEMTVNKNNGPYPAVGSYQTIIKFYYTFGDREKNPYPDRLLKVTVQIRRAAATETSEYLFDERGDLIFYSEQKDAKRIVYFAGEKPFRILQDEKRLPLRDRTAAELIKTILTEKRKLGEIFVNSLKF